MPRPLRFSQAELFLLAYSGVEQFIEDRRHWVLCSGFQLFRISVPGHK